MTKNTELVAICDPGPGGRQLAEDMGVPLHIDTHTLFAEKNVDGVIVSTPTEHHFLPTVQALDAGCHVLVEKPITATLSEADQIIGALEKELKTTKQKFKNSNNGRRRDAFDFE